MIFKKQPDSTLGPWKTVFHGLTYSCGSKLVKTHRKGRIEGKNQNMAQHSREQMQSMELAGVITKEIMTTRIDMRLRKKAFKHHRQNLMQTVAHHQLRID